MYQGKFWAVGGNPGNFRASKRTMWMLHVVSGGAVHYHEDRGITQDEAYDLLEKYRNAARSNYEEIITCAAMAANKAGERWLKQQKEPAFYIYHEEDDYEEPIYGRLGDCYIKRDGHSSFTDWVRKNIPALMQGGSNRLIIPHEFCERREFDLLKICEQTALKVMLASNIRGLYLYENSV